MAHHERSSDNTMGESHRDRAIRFSGMAPSSLPAMAIVHALLAVEEQVRNVAYFVGHGGDVRRMDCDDPTQVSRRERGQEWEPR